MRTANLTTVCHLILRTQCVVVTIPFFATV